MSERQKFSVIGLEVDATDYEEAASSVLAWAKNGEFRAIAAANTHLAVLQRRDSAFRKSISTFDMVLPDGMPLVWIMNRQGAGLGDRVYGPYFTRTVLQKSPPDLRHFFLGSTHEILDALRNNLHEKFPNVQICGTYSPPFGDWGESENKKIRSLIQEAEADLIWVSLGGGKQENWLHSQRHTYEKGVFCAVGDAFAMLAGKNREAPMWMQRNGLGWFFRLLQEPRRLFRRYFVNNLLFLYYATRSTAKEL